MMLLPVEVTFRNIDNPADLEDFIHTQAAGLERFYDRISSCRVILERLQRSKASKVYHVRIDLGVPNAELVVKHTPTLHGTLRDIKAERSREGNIVHTHKTPQQAIREAFREMRRRLQDYARKQAGSVKSSHKMTEGKVKELFPNQGYGFLETRGGHQVYFNQASVLADGFGRLRLGARVRFCEEMGSNGPQASTVKLVHPRKHARKAAASVPLPHKRAAAKRK